MDNKTTVVKFAVDRWDDDRKTWVSAGRLHVDRAAADAVAANTPGRTRVREVAVVVKLPSTFR